MEIKFDLSEGGKVKISTGSGKVRLDDINKWLNRNRDAVLVKLEGSHDVFGYRVGHICNIEEDDGKYNVFVGKHLIGQLPEEAIAFANQIDYSPEFMISIVGKIDYAASAEDDAIFIYIAE